MAALTTLYAFSGGLDGANPGYGSLIADAHGDLFGATIGGGATGDGTVFELVNTGSGYTFQTLASLNYATTGSGVLAGLTMDANGDLFGVAQSGGSGGVGTAFELVNTGSVYSIQTLASFSGANGSYPAGALVADANGDLFGTTQSGGDNGAGTVFELVKGASGYSLQTLVSFAGANGSAPTGPMIMDAQGDLFGTTLAGGSGGSGTVFELVNTGSGYSLQTLANFSGANGAFLYAGLTADARGDLFGTTYSGGPSGNGTVFELVKGASGYTLQTLATLDNATTGGAVIAGLTIDANGDLFGAAAGGGASDQGTVFELVHSAAGYSLQTLYAFSGPDGGLPEGAPILAANGNLIGTTSGGVGAGNGTVFELSAGIAPPSDASVHNGFVNAANDTSGQTIGGTAAAGDAVAIYDNGALVTTVTANNSGVWAYNVGVLADGPHSFIVTATDATGVTSAPSAALAFTVDTVPPDSAVGSVTVGAGGVATVSGSAEAGSTVMLYDGSSLVGEVTAGTGGTWSYAVGVLAAGSSHSYAVTATDAAGNTSAVSSPLSYTAGSTSSGPPAQPGAPVDAAVSGGYVNAAHDKASQTIGGTTEEGATVTIYDNGAKVAAVTADGAGAWTYKVGILANGSSHSYAVTATDGSGAVSAMSDALSFTVDTKRPTAPTGLADASISNGFVNAAHDTAGQSLTGTAEAGALVTVYDAGVKLGTAAADASTGAWTCDLGVLADGAHRLTATATDAAGNLSGVSAVLAFSVNTDPPTPAVNDVLSSSGQLTTISGVSEARSKVAVFDNGKQIGVATADAHGAWSLSTNLASGTVHQFTETASDTAGNTGASTGVTEWSSVGRKHLVGGSGDDVLIGRTGDRLTGGAGDDHFVFNAGFGKQTITDFTPGSDQIWFSHTAFHSFAAVMADAHRSGGNTVISDAAGDHLTLAGVLPSALSAGDFHFS